MGTIDQTNNKELFVLIGADSFFYGTNSPNGFSCASKSIGDLKDFILNNKSNPIQLWGDFPETFLVASEYLGYYDEWNENPEVHYYHKDYFPKLSANLVIPVPLAIHRLVNQSCPNWKWQFVGTQLIKEAFLHGGQGIFFAVFLWNNRFCLVYGTRGKIQLYNWININGIEDVVYYLALALQSFQLKGSEVQLFINGFGCSDFTMLEKYFPNLKVAISEDEHAWIKQLLF